MKQRIFVLLVLVIFGQSANAQTTFHGNIARSGVYDSPGPTELKGIKWTFKTAGAVFSSPAIVGGVVFIGSSDGCLYAVDQQTGQQKWKVTTEGPVASSPAVADGVVYFGSFDGGFYALAADTG